MPRNGFAYQKKCALESIVNNYNLPKKNKSLWLVFLREWDVKETLIDWLSELGVNFLSLDKEPKKREQNNIYSLSSLDDIDLIGLDFVITDSDSHKLEDFLKNGVVPIISKENYLTALLKEFNPMKGEWNAFIYEKDNVWSIFYAFIRYLENSKFPFDNKTLVQNVKSL